MAGQLPKAQRVNPKPPILLYVLVAAAVILVMVVGVLMFSGGLFSGQPQSDAERDYTILLAEAKKNPRDPAILMTLAEAEFALGKEGAALERAQTAVKYAEKAPQYRLRYAGLLVQADQIEKAREQLEAELALATPGDAEPLFLMAQVERELGDLESAAEHVDKGLEIAPTAADMRILYGDILAAQGKKDLATEQYRQALRFLPGDARAVAGLKSLGAEIPATDAESPHGGDAQ